MRIGCPVCGVAVLVVMILWPVEVFADPADATVFRIASRDYSTLYAEVDDGFFDFFPPVQVVVGVLETQTGLTELERESIVELLVIRTQRSASSTGSPFPRSLEAVLLDRFDRLNSPTLRARVLTIGSETDAAAMAPAVHDSAERLATTLATDGEDTVPGYEVEAMALCTAAPDYPSLPLADLLRSIAAHSRDRRVVDAARSAARAILASM